MRRILLTALPSTAVAAAMATNDGVVSRASSRSVPETIALLEPILREC